jgi:hypothetical protein
VVGGRAHSAGASRVGRRRSTPPCGGGAKPLVLLCRAAQPHAKGGRALRAVRGVDVLWWDGSVRHELFNLPQVQRHRALYVPTTVCGHTHVAWLTTPLRTQTDAPVRRADPRGTLLGIRYESVTDQGHVAVLLGEGPDARLLQSIAMSGPGGPRATTPGVNELYTLRECYAKFGCCKFEYALPPEEWLLAM